MNAIRQQKSNRSSFSLFSCTLAGFMLVGCAQQQQRGRYHPAPTPTPAKAPETPAKSGYGPSYTTFDENGVHWIRGSMGFPTGLRDSSGLLVEKTVPSEVLAGQTFDYAYKVSNLTDYPIENVSLMDRVTSNFSSSQADPQPSDTKDGVAAWHLGNLGPKESKSVHLKGSSADEGSVTTCGWATYMPVLCQDIRVVKAGIQLTKAEPADVIICDPIPVSLVVKNSGSSGLSGVKVTDTLPDGLASQDNLTFDVGNLGPGESKELKFNATASRTGQFVNKATVTCAQGISADASATTTVHAPVLTVACKAPDERFMGRPFDVCLTVANTGDAPAAGASAQLSIPAGLTFRSATSGGHVSGNNVVWDLGSLAANSPQQLCATLVGASAGTFQFTSTAKGACAKEVSSDCTSRVVGVAAILLEKADDPDPIGVGETTTYTVKITNQGTADDSNVKMIVTIAPELSPVSATGNGTIDGQTVTFPVVPRLAPKEAVSYQIVAKGVKAGDGHTLFKLTSDVLKSAISAEESTHVY